MLRSQHPKTTKILKIIKSSFLEVGEMHEGTKQYLFENAKSLYRDFLDRNPPGRDDKQSLHTAYRLLELLADGPNSAEALGLYLGRSAHTIFEYMGIFQEAGLPVVRTSRENNKLTGRPITIFSININKKKR